MVKIIFLVGPTAIGKTEASFLLARQIRGEIISADSMLIYKEAKIITASPSCAVLKEVIHHFINIKSVEEVYSAFEYYKEAGKLIKSLHKSDIPVIICGGSGLYIKALLDGIFEGGEENIEYRKILEDEARIYGKDFLFAKLQEIDRDTAGKISPSDLKRIIRALEVYYVSGRPISKKKTEADGLYDKLPIKIFGLQMKRENIYDKINKRVDKMFEQGAVEEVKNLFTHNLSKTASQIIGVKEIKGYLEGECSIETAKEVMKKNTRHFAKRQMTWFKKDERIEWLDVDNLTTNQIVEELIRRIGNV